jgi:Flp pilus assembly protein TadG
MSFTRAGTQTGQAPCRRHRRRSVRLRARARESRGQSTVELALVLPLLALVLFACLKLGLAFFSYEQVASAANAGARAAAVNHGGDPTVAARAAAQSMSATLGLTDSQVSVSYVSTASPPGAAWSYPGTVTVTVDYPITFSLLGEFPQTYDLQASATKRLER